MAIFVTRHYNFLLYFTITTVVLYIGPSIVKSILRKQGREVPVVNAPVGDISGTLMSTRHGRDIFAYRGNQILDVVDNTNVNNDVDSTCRLCL
jgi:S-adenosylmethionine hydrolase